MKILLIDQSYGVAGDMLNAGLFGLHKDHSVLEDAVRALKIPDLSVKCVLEESAETEQYKFTVEFQEGHIHRTMKNIRSILNESSLPEDVRSLSLKTFECLASAEGAVHGKKSEEVEFHEVGSLDAIADIVCACASFCHLQPEKVCATPYHVGSGGTVKSMHGLLPVPVPAVVKIIKGLPCTSLDVQEEITTPTGAVLVRMLADEWAFPSVYKIINSATGAGTKKMPHPNCIRLFQAETAENNDQVWVLETNIDDMNPQIIPVFIQDCLDAGALDAFCAPVLMKKGRPAYRITVLSCEKTKSRLQELILRSTSSIGIRFYAVQRICLPRKKEIHQTGIGPVKFKTVTLPDGKKRSMPEFEDVLRISREKKISLQEAYGMIGQGSVH